MDPGRSNQVLAERILTARRRMHAKQEHVAEACGVSRQLVGRWERGKAIPDIIQAARLARYTNQSLDWFVLDLSDQDSPNSWCNSVEQLDLFSLVPQVADVRSGGTIWEFSDRSSGGTSTSADDAASGLARQLVA